MTNTDSTFTSQHPQSATTGRFVTAVPSPQELEDFAPAAAVSIDDEGTLHFVTADGQPAEFFPDTDDSQVAAAIAPRTVHLPNGNTKLIWASQSDEEYEWNENENMWTFLNDRDRMELVDRHVRAGVPAENIYLIDQEEGAEQTFIRLSDRVENVDRTGRAPICSVIVFGSNYPGRIIPQHEAEKILAAATASASGDVYDLHVLEFDESGEPLDDTRQYYLEFAGVAYAQAAVDSGEY